MKILSLGVNKLTGNIPPSIGQMNQLVWLSASFNSLEGIPTTIGSLTSLETLGLGSNKLISGSIPSEIGNCRNLKNLFLDNNKLEGSIPSSIGNLKRLRNLWLGANQLSGEIPASLGTLDSLEDLVLNVNQFSGKVPTTFNQLKVKRLQLGTNRLTGVPNLTNVPFKDSITDVNGNRTLGGLIVNKNKLTFESILPNISLAQTASYRYILQDSIFKDSTIIGLAGGPLSINLRIDSAITSNSYQWFKNGKKLGNPSASNTLTINTVSFEDGGIYTCEVTNPQAPNLVLKSHAIKVMVSQKVVTLISPDGDGMNDKLDFPSVDLEKNPDNTIEIYNRWGQQVFRANPYKRDWSGQNEQGQPLPGGDYFFIMRVNVANGQIIVGSVYLQR